MTNESHSICAEVEIPSLYTISISTDHLKHLNEALGTTGNYGDYFTDQGRMATLFEEKSGLIASLLDHVTGALLALVTAVDQGCYLIHIVEGFSHHIAKSLLASSIEQFSDGVIDIGLDSHPLRISKIIPSVNSEIT